MMMDSRGFEDRSAVHADADDAFATDTRDPALDPTDGGVGEHEHQIAIGTDERRMHVRAYNHWVSLLRDRPYPAIADLDPAGIADFGPNSVLLDFSDGVDNPSIQYIGRTLREECGVDQTITRIGQVPARSLLSRLTDHYLQIIANRTPIGFEAEFVGTRGQYTMYRGILMPFSSDGETIDFIYGVINWKVTVAPDIQAQLDAELAAVVGNPPAAAEGTPAWADGPSAASDRSDETEGALADHLAAARESAAAAVAAATRSHAALYRAIGRAFDFALATDDAADDYAELLSDAGITVQARAPMTAVAKLVFGADYDKTRLTEVATVLAHARRTAVPAGGLARLIESTRGGIKAIVAQERAARQAETGGRPAARVRATTDHAVIARVAIDTGLAPDAMVVLVGRVGADGAIEVIGSIADERVVAGAARRLR